MYGGMCLGEYTRSMLNVAPVLNAANIQHSAAFVYNDSLITSARNKLAASVCESIEGNALGNDQRGHARNDGDCDSGAYEF